MQVGSVVECREKKKVFCAVCLDVKPQQLRLLLGNGKELSLNAGKVLQETGHVLDAGQSRVQLLESLRRTEAAIEAARAGVNLEELWEVVHEEGRPFALAELVDLLWGSNRGAELRSALLRELVADSLYFDLHDAGFLARAAGQVRELQRQRQTAESRQLEKQKGMALLQRAWRSEPVAAGEAEACSPWLPLLQGLALHGEHFERYSDAAALLREIGASPGSPMEAANAALQVLVRLGVWHPDENLSLLRHQVPQRLNRAALEEANELALTPYLEAGTREDLRGWELFTIDDQETMDIDDALSLRQTEAGLELGVHIADPAHFIPAQSALDKEATARATSIYLPDRKLEMLPERLSQDLCSLVAGNDRYALSLLAVVDGEGRLQSWRLAETVVRVARRLTYEEANGLIEAGTAPFTQLYSLARALQRRRVEGGALIQDRPQLKIRVGDGGRINIERISPEQPAQILVSEMMILANQMVAQHFSERQIPAIYRVQNPPDVPLEHEVPPRLKGALFNTRPAPHFSLGLAAYTQITSPIRRYIDLVLHRQLKADLQGLPPPYTEPQLNFLLASSEQARTAAAQVERETNRYWLLKYLQGKGDELVTAIVQEFNEGRAFTHIEEYLLDAPVYPRNRIVKPGDSLRLRISQVDPHRRYISFVVADELDIGVAGDGGD